MKTCPNCNNTHAGETSRCGYCLAVTEPRSRKYRGTDDGDSSTDDAVAEYQQDNQEQADSGGWIR